MLMKMVIEVEESRLEKSLLQFRVGVKRPGEQDLYFEQSIPASYLVVDSVIDLVMKDATTRIKRLAHEHKERVGADASGVVPESKEIRPEAVQGIRDSV